MGGMGGMAAALTVLVQARGINELNRDLRSVDSGLTAAGRNASASTKHIEDTGKRGGGALRKLGAVAKGVGAIAIGAGLMKGAKDSIMAFEESRKVGKLTESVLKSTGGAANVTAKQVSELAGSISRKTGVDDEAIQSGSNLLLTFTKIRNETGKGRDIFNQATQAAVDLSASGFGSIESTSKQLGKALNDPIKGMTALGRSGVTFSEQQQKAIKALMSTGKAADRVKAQQMILKEVQTQVGGSAAAQGSAMDKLKVSFGNIQESIGGFLIPILDKAALFMSKLFNQMQDGTGAGGKIVQVFNTVKAAISGVVGVIMAIIGWFAKHEAAAKALGAVLVVVGAAFLALKVQMAFTALLSSLVKGFWALNAALAANPIGLVVVAIAALVAGLVYAYTESETFRKIVNGALGAVATAFGWMLNAAKDVFGWLKSNWPLVLAILTGPIGLAIAAIVTFGPKLFEVAKGLLSKFIDGVKAMVSQVVAVGGWIVSQVATGVKAITGFGSDVGGWIVNKVAGGIKAVSGFAADVGGWIKNRVVEGVKAFADTINELGGWVIGKIVAGAKAVGGLGSDIGEFVKDKVVGGLRKVMDAFSGIGGDIVRGVASGIRSAAGSITDAIRDAVESAWNWVKKKFKIKSPSLVFAELGKNLSLGMAQGITSEASKVQRAMQSITQLPRMGALPITLAVPPATRASMASQASTGASTGMNAEDALVASNNRLANRLDALLASGVSVVTLTDTVGSSLGNQAQARSMTAGNPSTTAINY